VLEVLVGRLRRKLDPDGTLVPIETLRGRGYRLTLKDRSSDRTPTGAPPPDNQAS
jgi:two-component system response regulator PhoP